MIINCRLPNGNSAPVFIPDKRLLPSGELPVPITFEGLRLFENFFDTLDEMTAAGDKDAQARFSNLLLNRFGEPPQILKRQISHEILKQIRKLRKSNELGISQFIKPMTTNQLYVALWKETEATLFGPGPTKKLKMLNDPGVANEFQSGLVKAYRETHDGSHDSVKSLDNFRERIERLRLRLGITGEQYRHLRQIAVFQSAAVWTDMADSYLKGAAQYYTGPRRELFRLIHSLIPRPHGVESALLSLPPIAWMYPFPALRKLYKEEFKSEIMEDAYSFVINCDNPEKEQTINIFLSRVLACLAWYRTIYLQSAAEDDRESKNRQTNRTVKRHYIGNLHRGSETNYYDEESKDDLDCEDQYGNRGTTTSNEDLEAVDEGNQQNEDNEDAEFIDESFTEALIIGAIDRDLQGEDAEASDVSSAYSLKIRQRFLATGISTEKMLSEIHKRCRPKQVEVLCLHWTESLSPQKIAEKLGKKRQTVQGILQTGFKRLKE